MTTINNLTIEQMREIVEGAPEGATHIRRGIYFKYRNPVEWHYWEENQWKFTSSDITKSVFLIDLNDLRTAIAKHDTAWMEKRFGIKKWYPIPEHHMCSDKRTDDTTDHVTDIRNHVSPSTIVKDLEVERHG